MRPSHGASEEKPNLWGDSDMTKGFNSPRDFTSRKSPLRDPRHAFITTARVSATGPISSARLIRKC